MGVCVRGSVRCGLRVNFQVCSQCAGMYGGCVLGMFWVNVFYGRSGRYLGRGGVFELSSGCIFCVHK